MSLCKNKGYFFFFKKSILLVVLLFSSPALFAQDAFYTTFALTPADNTGYGYHTFSKPGLYFSFGKSSDIEMLKASRFSYGLAFSQKGARKAQNPSQNDYVEYNVRLNYAEANTLFWFKLKSLKAIAGLNLGYLFNKTEKSVNGITVSTSNFRKIDFSGTAGLGIMIGSKLLLQLTASYSIFPVSAVGGLGRVAFARGPRNVLVNIGFTYLFIKKPEPEEIPEEE